MLAVAPWLPHNAWNFAASLHVVNKDLHIRHLNLPHTHQTYMSGFSTKSPIFWCLNEVYTIDITGARRELISRILSIIPVFCCHDVLRHVISTYLTIALVVEGARPGIKWLYSHFSRNLRNAETCNSARN